MSGCKMFGWVAATVLSLGMVAQVQAQSKQMPEAVPPAKTMPAAQAPMAPAKSMPAAAAPMAPAKTMPAAAPQMPSKTMPPA
jgi:hypothetical protein